MKDVLIVDGYNVIWAWQPLQELAAIDLEAARDQLIQLLSDYQGYTGLKVIIVFDAHQVPGMATTMKYGSVDVRFTKEKETADECIEKLVVELTPHCRNIYVATSDSVEQSITFGKGALRISARELWLDLQNIQQEIREQIDPSRQIQRNNPFDQTLSDEMKQQLEKWRRGE